MGRRARDWAAAVALASFATLVSFGGSELIAANFAGRPRPADLLFRALPQFDPARHLADVAVLLAMALLVAHVWRADGARVPGLVAEFSVFYALRAAIMVLTPLAQSHGDAPYYSLIHISQNGNFPSGHAGAAMLCFLLVDGKRAPRLRWLLLALAVTEALSLLLSRSHYSIDVVGGWLLAYFVWREWGGGRLFSAIRGFFAE